MAHFHYQNNTLHAENCALSTLAEKHGTPCYVYSKAAFTEHYQAYAQALGSHPGMICYAVKANSSLAILQLLAKLGAGFDIVSEGELRRVLAAGGKPERIIFSGVGKTEAEIRFALQQQIACFNVESAAELEVLSAIASDMDVEARISLRVNPDVDAQTHPYISTGLKENKFGIDIDTARAVYQRAADLPGLQIVGVDCHIGSQLTSLAPFLDALDRLLLLIDQLQEDGITLRHVDLGGGIGVCYNDEQPPKPSDYLDQVKQRLGDRKLSIILEPGRSIAANAGVLLTQVVYLKPTAHKNFAVINGAMNDNIRPSLYKAWQKVLPVAETSPAASKQWDLVGPVCETGDFLAKDRDLALNAGDYLALMSSGAYGFVMASNYNTRGRPPEILVDGERDYVIRDRESFADLIHNEHLLPGEINV